MPQKDTADPKTAQELRAFNREWVERYSKHDAAALAALFTDDAVQVAPEGLILRSAGHRETLCRHLPAVASH
jgi:ketosteroid isomerase-like protein